MNNDIFLGLRSIFSALWNMLGSYNVPGTSLTGLHLLIGPLGAVAFITALKKIMDIGGASSTYLGSVVHEYKKQSSYTSPSAKEEE